MLVKRSARCSYDPKNLAFNCSSDLRKRSIHTTKIHRGKYLQPVAREITLADVQRFARRICRRGSVEGLVHGNLQADEAIWSARLLVDTLKVHPVPSERLFDVHLLVQPEAEGVLAVEKLEVNNSCFWREYVIGEDTPETRAVSLVLDNFLREPFYTAQVGGFYKL